MLRLSAGLLVAYLLGSPGDAGAQLSVLISAGLSQASASETTGSDTGVALGADLVLPVADRVMLSVGIGYVERGLGDEIVTPTGNGFSSLSIGTKYLDLPLLLRVHLGSDAQLSPYLFAGPGIGLAVGCAAEGGVFQTNQFGQTVGFSEISSSCSEAGFASAKSVQLDGRGGIGVRIGSPDGLSATAAVWYSVGLTPTFSSGDSKSRALVAQAGIGLPIG